MIDDDIVLVESGTGARRLRLGDYIDASAEEHASACEYTWIKRLRTLRVDGLPMRRRFTFRGDSLWWFSELYLHKEQVVLNLFRTIAALERIVEEERPLQIDVSACGAIVRDLARHTGATYRLHVRGGRSHTPRLLRLDLRAAALRFAALASRMRANRHTASDLGGRTIAVLSLPVLK